MSEIKLDAGQEDLKQKIICLFKEIKEMLKTPSPVGMREKIDQMGQLAHELHRSLTPPPKHHRYMIKNRGLKPDHPDFYKHIHPVEDLLNYLEDDTANDDPIDQTINKKFLRRSNGDIISSTHDSSNLRIFSFLRKILSFNDSKKSQKNNRKRKTE